LCCGVIRESFFVFNQVIFVRSCEDLIGWSMWKS